MNRLEESKSNLSKAFNRLEHLIDKKLSQVNNTQFEDDDSIEMLKKANQSLLEQNSNLQKKLFSLEHKYNELRSINKETALQIDDIVSSLKQLVSK